MDVRFLKNEELQDKEIIELLKKAADWYEEGSIIEVRDLLEDIVYAINEFEDRQKG